MSNRGPAHSPCSLIRHPPLPRIRPAARMLISRCLSAFPVGSDPKKWPTVDQIRAHATGIFSSPRQKHAGLREQRSWTCFAAVATCASGWPPGSAHRRPARSCRLISRAHIVSLGPGRIFAEQVLGSGRSRSKLALAIAAMAGKLFRTCCAEGAFKGANSCVAISGREVASAMLAIGPHIQHDANPLDPVSGISDNIASPFSMSCGRWIFSGRPDE